MEYIGEADLNIRCFKPFYRWMSVKTAIHVTRDTHKDQVIISLSLQQPGLSIAEIDVTLQGAESRFIVYSSSSVGNSYELHCYSKSE